MHGRSLVEVLKETRQGICGQRGGMYLRTETLQKAFRQALDLELDQWQEAAGNPG